MLNSRSILCLSVYSLLLIVSGCSVSMGNRYSDYERKEIDGSHIRDTFNSNYEVFYNCYKNERLLGKVDPSVLKVMTQFFVNSEGEAGGVKITSNTPTSNTFKTCIEERIKALNFENPYRRGKIEVKQSLIFKPKS